MEINWVKTIYGNGRGWHVGSMVEWRGTYYICFVDGTGHGTEDSQIRVAASTDLENWTSRIAMGKTCIDPQLLPVGERLFLYAVKVDLSKESDVGTPSWEVLASTADGVTWSEPKRCYLIDRDFWHPTEHGGRYYVACDNAGHAPKGTHSCADLLTSEDGEHWTWVSEIIHGSEEHEYHDPTIPEHFGTPAPSEASLSFSADGRLLAVIRARGYCAVLATSEPPHDKWEYRLSRSSRCYGSAVARAGGHIVVTGRSFDNEGVRATTTQFPEKGARTGVFLYEDGDIKLYTLLPSGGDTGYAGILPLSDSEVLIAYYSAHEYPEGGGSNVYLASVSVP